MTAEQKARDILERLDVEDAQSYTTGDLVELANIIVERDGLKEDKAKLAEWLKRAIHCMDERTRTVRKTVEVDSAGNTYEVSLQPWVREALVAIGEDPEKYL